MGKGTGYVRTGHALGGPLPTIHLPGATVVQVAFTDSASASSGALSGRFVRLWADAECWVKASAKGADTPTAATTTSLPITAKQPAYFSIEDGGEIAVIGSSGSSGTLTIVVAPLTG